MKVLYKEKREILLIPSYFARDLKETFPEVSILGIGKLIDNVSIENVEMTPKMEYLLKEVITSLKDIKYEVDYKICVASFDDKTILGKANIKEKLIYLFEKVFDMGRREIALTLIEENEHIISGKGDKTRGFQTHLISSWLKTMENENGLFF